MGQYWAKIDHLIASQHINTQSKLGKKILETCVQRCFWGEGQGQGMCELENALEIQKYPNFCP